PHPGRRSGRMNFFASATLGTLRFARSQLKDLPVRSATFPRSRASVTIAENSKFAPGLVLLPLQASSHCRWLTPPPRCPCPPPLRGSSVEPPWESESRRGLLPLNPQRIVP